MYNCGSNIRVHDTKACTYQGTLLVLQIVCPSNNKISLVNTLIAVLRASSFSAFVLSLLFKEIFGTKVHMIQYSLGRRVKSALNAE